MFDFFYSDPHFSNENVLKYANRPFADVSEMNKELIDRYNEVVGAYDFVCWLGGCFFDYEAASAIMRVLHGQKVLVRGSHDKSCPAMLRLGFNMVLDGPVHWHAEGTDYILSHYPPGKDLYEGQYTDRRPRPVNGETVLHGHTHETIRHAPGRVHVGVDAWDFRPVPRADI